MIRKTIAGLVAAAAVAAPLALAAPAQAADGSPTRFDACCQCSTIGSATATRTTSTASPAWVR